MSLHLLPRCVPPECSSVGVGRGGRAGPKTILPGLHVLAGCAAVGWGG